MSQSHPSRSSPNATSSGQLQAPQKPLACLPCRQRKTGCDHRQPQCTSCQRSGFQCSYPPRTRIRRATKVAKITELTKRLNRLEQALDQSGQVPAETGYIEGSWNLPNGGGDSGSDNNRPTQTSIQREDDIQPSRKPAARADSYMDKYVWRSLSAQVRQPMPAGGLLNRLKS